MKNWIKSALGRFAPRVKDAITSYNNMKLSRRMHSATQRQIKDLLYPGSEARVIAGLFAGMRYIDAIVWGPITPKWLGTYEKELWSIIGEILTAIRPKVIIDVGAAEGYYAVGLAHQLATQSRVFSYDLDHRARGCQKQLAELNGVNNLSIKTLCDHAELNTRIISGETLVICDIEGSEHELLNPTIATQLTKTNILVELHPTKSLDLPTLHKLMIERFSATHTIQTIPVSPRCIADRPTDLVKKLTDVEFLKAADEFRGFAQSWLWMRSVES